MISNQYIGTTDARSTFLKSICYEACMDLSNMGYEYGCLLEREVHHSFFFSFLRMLKHFKWADQRWLLTDVSGQPIVPIFKGKAVRKETTSQRCVKSQKNEYFICRRKPEIAEE
jgi:hypothetical protein